MSVRSRLYLGFAALALPVVMLAGCGGKPRAEGTVSFDGQPVDGGTITFVPTEGDGKRVGEEIKDGKYATSPDRLLTPGKYKVEIYWRKKTGKTLPNANDPGTTVDEVKEVIPMKYNTKSELTAEIKSGSNTVSFELKAGGPVDTSGPVPPGGAIKPARD